MAMTDLVSRDLLTAALVRLVPPGTSVCLLGTHISRNAEGDLLQLRNAAGTLLEDLYVHPFFRADADASIASDSDAASAPRG